MNIKLLTLFFLISISTIAQSNRKIMHGKVINDSLSVEKIHIINKNSLRGTVSNKYGDFAIPVKVNDTLIFSAIQFENYTKIISKSDLQKIQVLVNLTPRINKLDEIVIKPISVAKKLNLPNADKKPKSKLNARLDGHSKASVPIVILTTLIGGAGGIDNLYYVLSGERKKDRKLKKLIQQDELIKFNNKTAAQIRLHFKDDFFIYLVGIPSKEIDSFINFCIKDNILDLYNEKRYLEIIEIFFRKKESFMNQIKE